MSVIPFARSQPKPGAPFASGGRRALRLAAAADIGATKAAVVIALSGEARPERAHSRGPRHSDHPDQSPGDLRLLGIGVHSLSGAGRNAPDCADDGGRTRAALALALAQAQWQAGRDAPEGAAFAVVSGGLAVRARRSGAIIDLPDAPVAADSVRAALFAAREEALAEAEHRLHLMPLGYRLDGGPLLHDPRGRRGRRLCAENLVLAARAPESEPIRAVLAELVGEPQGPVAAGFASGLAVMSEEDTRHDCLVLDIGARATDIAWFEAGRLAALDRLPFGGDRITADLAAALGGTFQSAEKTKRSIGDVSAAGLADSRRVKIARKGPDGRLVSAEATRAAINQALAARVEEIFDITSRNLRAAGVGKLDRSRVLLTGGGALLRGLPDCAKRVFGGAPCIAGPGLRGPGGEPLSPAFSAVIGALIWRAGLSADLVRPPALAEIPTRRSDWSLAEARRWFARTF